MWFLQFFLTVFMRITYKHNNFQLNFGRKILSKIPGKKSQRRINLRNESTGKIMMEGVITTNYE